MKNLLKKIGLIFLIIVLLIVGVWYFYFWNRFSNLQEIDRKTIISTFKPDTAGRGYSDDGEKILRHDVQMMSKKLTPEELEDYEYWFKELLKIQRVLILSENRNLFIENSKKQYIALKCFLRYSKKVDGESLLYQEKDESDDFYRILQELERKNFKFLTADEIFEIQNPVRKKDFNKCFNELRDKKL